MSSHAYVPTPNDHNPGTVAALPDPAAPAFAGGAPVPESQPRLASRDDDLEAEQANAARRGLKRSRRGEKFCSTVSNIALRPGDVRFYAPAEDIGRLMKIVKLSFTRANDESDLEKAQQCLLTITSNTIRARYRSKRGVEAEYSLPLNIAPEGLGERQAVSFAVPMQFPIDLFKPSPRSGSKPSGAWTGMCILTARPITRSLFVEHDNACFELFADHEQTPEMLSIDQEGHRKSISAGDLKLVAAALSLTMAFPKAEAEWKFVTFDGVEARVGGTGVFIAVTLNDTVDLPCDIAFVRVEEVASCLRRFQGTVAANLCDHVLTLSDGEFSCRFPVESDTYKPSRTPLEAFDGVSRYRMSANSIAEIILMFSCVGARRPVFTRWMDRGSKGLQLDAFVDGEPGHGNAIVEYGGRDNEGDDNLACGTLRNELLGKLLPYPDAGSLAVAFRDGATLFEIAGDQYVKRFVIAHRKGE